VITPTFLPGGQEALLAWFFNAAPACDATGCSHSSIFKISNNVPVVDSFYIVIDQPQPFGHEQVL
jgi:hypothetical protein